VTGEFDLLRPIVERTSLIVKPYLGHRGLGIHVVRTPAELDRIPPPEGAVVVQEFIEGSDEDLKLYVVGDEVYGVRKPFSPTSFTVPGRPCAVSDEAYEIAIRVGRALGLGLYGIDVIEGPAGPVVVDVNYFPGYKGIPDVAAPIAAYIARYAHGDTWLEPPVDAAVEVGA
jgi:ribosomal protein S6--L-glutamate ligase